MKKNKVVVEEEGPEKEGRKEGRWVGNRGKMATTARRIVRTRPSLTYESEAPAAERGGSCTHYFSDNYL